MILSDFHVHTIYCDGADTPETMVLAGIEKGLSSIGILAHSYTSFDSRYCLQKEKIQEFISEINRLKEKYKDKIKVFCGVEQDYFADFDTNGFDYAIGSVHYVEVDGKRLEIDESEEITVDIVNKYFNGDWYALIDCYYGLVGKVIEKTGADIIGHFDIITKFNEGGKYFDETDARYVKSYTSAVDKLIPFNKPFEINTGAVYKGYKALPYPSFDIIAYIEEKGGKFILSSDSHKKESLCYTFDRLEEFNGFFK